MPKTTDRSDVPDSRCPASRPPYEPPRIEESADFETLALQCGRTSGPNCYYTGGYTS